MGRRWSTASTASSGGGANANRNGGEERRTTTSEGGRPNGRGKSGDDGGKGGGESERAARGDAPARGARETRDDVFVFGAPPAVGAVLPSPFKPDLRGPGDARHASSRRIDTSTSDASRLVPEKGGDLRQILEARRAAAAASPLGSLGTDVASPGATSTPSSNSTSKQSQSSRERHGRGQPREDAASLAKEKEKGKQRPDEPPEKATRKDTRGHESGAGKEREGGASNPKRLPPPRETPESTVPASKKERDRKGGSSGSPAEENGEAAVEKNGGVAPEKNAEKKGDGTTAAAETARAEALARQLEAERAERARAEELAEQMREQAESLLLERAKLAQLTSNLTREKSGMQEILDHQAQALEHTGDEADALAAELAEARAELEALRGKYG